MTTAWDRKLIGFMKRLKRRPVCILVKTDEVCCSVLGLHLPAYLFPLKINSLFHMILYVRKNEETSCLKIIHFYEEEKGVPSELEANAKSTLQQNGFAGIYSFPAVLDEAFPELTVDLVRCFPSDGSGIHKHACRRSLCRPCSSQQT